MQWREEGNGGRVTRIAGNTAILYMRMLLILGVSLYTSRVVLDALGVVDYGLYNVVGGVVVALGFLSATLNATALRFVTVALSTCDMDEMRKTFSNIMLINILLAMLILVLGETLGLWLLYDKMVIPADRFNAAFWVYQMSIATVMVGVVSSPYNACIIAHERMKVFACISLIDAFGRLCVALALPHIGGHDKLVAYGFMLLIVQVAMRFVYSIYCMRHFEETRVGITPDKPMLREMLGFTAWASYGSFVSVGFTQGLNILLNIFFGPAVNAARAVAVQVQSAVTSFTTNFQTAINPSVIKSVATKDFQSARSLLLASSKFSFFLLCLIGVPLIAFSPYVLRLWLKSVPDHTVWFVRIMIVTCIWNSLANPLRIINQAEGNIKKFQMYECTALLFIVPVAYVVLLLTGIPETVFIVHFVIDTLSGLIRIRIVLPKIEMSMGEYFHKVYAPLSLVFIAFILMGSCVAIVTVSASLSCKILSLTVLEALMLATICAVGLNRQERGWIYSIVKSMFSKK